MPPSRAMAIAMRASVTVSIALETQRRRDGDAAGQARRGVGLARDDVGVPGQQQDVVVGESDEAERVVLLHGFSCARGALLEVDDDGRCARNAPYSILSVGAANSFRERAVRRRDPELAIRLVAQSVL